MAAYRVKTKAFEGPLDLLLNLIEQRKLLINDVSLAAVTDDFIEHVNVDTSIALSERAHFVLVASTLLFLKSKSLLPTLELTEEEEQGVEDLERRLHLYRIFRTLSGEVRKQFGECRQFTRRSHETTSQVIFSPHPTLTPDTIQAHVCAVLQSLPLQDPAPKAVVENIVNLEEAIQGLAGRIGKALNLSFREFSGLGRQNKTHVIVNFLAMLELVKQGIISVTQSERFADITMESDSVSTPTYS